MQAIMENISGLLIIAVSFTVLVTVYKRFFTSAHTDQETERKAIHIITGTCMLPLPWLFSSIWPVALLMSLIILGPFMLPFVPNAQKLFGRSVTVSRQNMGIPLFGLSYMILFTLSKDYKYCYVSACLVMIFADAIAAVIGTQYPFGRFKLADTSKSLSGSASFFVTSVICVLASVWIFTPTTLSSSIEQSVIVSGIATSLEALSFAGIDNFLVPITVFYVLRWLS